MKNQEFWFLSSFLFLKRATITLEFQSYRFLLAIALEMNYSRISLNKYVECEQDAAVQIYVRIGVKLFVCNSPPFMSTNEDN